MNIALEHVAIPSPNPVALKSWYERVLGAREIFNNGQTPPTCLLVALAASAGAMLGGLARLAWLGRDARSARVAGVVAAAGGVMYAVIALAR